MGSTIDRDTSFKLLDLYVEQGGNFIDTANVYANWLPIEKSKSEKTIGQWLRERGCREQIILATKGAHPELDTMHVPRMSRADIEQDLNESLRNLQTDVIDLYWLHRDDPQRPVGEILESLSVQVKAGKIRWYGCSNWRTERIRAAQAYAAEKGLPAFVANQAMWSLALADPAGFRDKTMLAMDEEMKRYHHQTGLAAIPYSSQGQGLFHKMARGALAQMDPDARAMYEDEPNRDRFKRVEQMAMARGLSISQVVLGYLQSQPFPTIPIIGPRTVAQLQDSLTAAEVRLDPEQVRYLDSTEEAEAS
jgi:aryl-alcohol dehydrogenase-like predicted oxidoreductase